MYTVPCKNISYKATFYILFIDNFIIKKFVSKIASPSMYFIINSFYFWPVHSCDAIGQTFNIKIILLKFL